MKSYPEYKSSGIDWLGEIPSHWSHKSFKWIFDTNTGITFTKSDLTETGNAVISYGQIHSIQNRGTGVVKSLIRFIPDSIACGKENALLRKDDFLFADTSEDLEGCGNCVYIDLEDPIYSGYHSIICRPKNNDLYGKYLAYLFKSDEWRHQIRSRVYGVKLFSVTQTILSKTTVLIPSFEEQEKIAAYLDDKTAKIDALVAEKQAQVEDLRKYRMSLITETVTRGLNPDAPLHPSGIDWIGDIPKHWECLKMKYCVEISNGSDPKTDGDIPVYGSGATSFKTCGEYKLGPTVLLGRKGATLHIPHWIEGKYWNVDTAFDTHAKTDFDLRFFFYVAMIFDYGHYKSETTLPSMTQKAYENARIPVPPISEQKEIAEFLDGKTAKIDELIGELEAQLKELADYKKAVISEAVTGKVDVRDWKSED